MWHCFGVFSAQWRSIKDVPVDFVRNWRFRVNSRKYPTTNRINSSRCGSCKDETCHDPFSFFGQTWKKPSRNRSYSLKRNLPRTQKLEDIRLEDVIWMCLWHKYLQFIRNNYSVFLSQVLVYIGSLLLSVVMNARVDYPLIKDFQSQIEFLNKASNFCKV